MTMRSEIILKQLINNISNIEEIQSIGISGIIDPIPKAGEGDIDIFIYCEVIPKLDVRKTIVNQMGDLLQEVRINVFEGGHWGSGDFALINGVETWIMYFTLEDTLNDIKSILNGNCPDRLDNYYYPVGRCAMFKNINVLYDKNNFLYSIKKQLSDYPNELSNLLAQYHLAELEDIEDLERAVARKDVLFYHFALDLAIDHYLQALFAINKIYFPSRKRTLQFIVDFHTKPNNCEENLLEVVRLGSSSEGINKSYELWRKMVTELKRIYETYFSI